MEKEEGQQRNCCLFIAPQRKATNGKCGTWSKRSQSIHPRQIHFLICLSAAQPFTRSPSHHIQITSNGWMHASRRLLKNFLWPPCLDERRMLAHTCVICDCAHLWILAQGADRYAAENFAHNEIEVNLKAVFFHGCFCWWLCCNHANATFRP